MPKVAARQGRQGVRGRNNEFCMAHWLWRTQRACMDLPCAATDKQGQLRKANLGTHRNMSSWLRPLVAKAAMTKFLLEDKSSKTRSTLTGT